MVHDVKAKYIDILNTMAISIKMKYNTIKFLFNFSVGARSAKTKKINNTVNPEWNFVADFPIEVVKGQQLTLEIMDHDDPGDDEFLGKYIVFNHYN